MEELNRTMSEKIFLLEIFRWQIALNSKLADFLCVEKEGVPDGTPFLNRVRGFSFPYSIGEQEGILSVIRASGIGV